MTFMSPMERVAKLIEERKRLEAILDSSRPIPLKELAATQEKLKKLEEEIKTLERRTAKKY